MSDQPACRHYDRAARLAALKVAKEQGWLEGHSLQEIADKLGTSHRSQIMRDLRAIDNYTALVGRFTAALENLKS